MYLGIIPGWLLAAFFAIEFGDLPADWSIAGAALGIGFSVALASGSWKALRHVLALMLIMAVRFLMEPFLADPSIADQGAAMHMAQVLSTPTALIVVSLFSMVASGIIGVVWVHRGKV